MSSLINMRAINAMSLENSSTAACNDHKVLVCLFNSGGLDAYNMLVPMGTSEYNTYKSVRSNQALPLSELRVINPLNSGGRSFGLHPSMPKIQELFNNGNLAFISNIGALVAPMTKSEYFNEKVVSPFGLFSHSDQQMIWQTGFADKRDGSGWAGRISDLLNSCNANVNIPMNISFSGSNILQTGLNNVEFSIYADNPTNGIESDYVNPQYGWWLERLKKKSLTNILDATYLNVFERTFKNTLSKSRAGVEVINQAINTAPKFENKFSDTYLSNSFKVAAQMISNHMVMGSQRQIFFIDYGGWDHHDELLESQAEMLTEMDTAISEFQSALNSINKQNNVITFSISEFSRTLTSNGNGTDHAWGTHVFALGGPVFGQKIYGEFPESLALNGSREVGGGVFVPKIAAEEYFAELALWFGVSPSSLNELYPNLKNFYSANGTKPIGFLKF
jgi:uncharacterized protein (DUF1501 family)